MQKSQAKKPDTDIFFRDDLAMIGMKSDIIFSETASYLIVLQIASV